MKRHASVRWHRCAVMNEIRAKLRKLRIIQWFIFGYVLACTAFAEWTLDRTGSRWPLMHLLVRALASVCVLEGFYLRSRFLPPAIAALAGSPGDSRFLRRWEAWQLISLAMGAAVSL